MNDEPQTSPYPLFTIHHRLQALITSTPCEEQPVAFVYFITAVITQCGADFPCCPLKDRFWIIRIVHLR